MANQEIKDITYGADTQLLRVEMQSGDIFEYAGVPQLVYQGLLSSTSPNDYMDDMLTDHYPHKIISNK